MKKYIQLLYIAVLFSSVYSAFATDEEHDYAFEKKSVFRIKGQPGNYSLDEKTTTSYTYLSSRVTDQDVFYVPQHYFDQVTEVDAEFRGRSISPRYITFEYPGLEDIFLSDFKIHKIIIPDKIKVGDQFSYTYRKDYQDLAFFPLIYIPNLDYIKNYTIVIEHPDNVRLDVECFFPREAIPYTINRDEDDETVLSFSNVKFADKLPYFAHNGSHAVIQCIFKQNGKKISTDEIPDFTRWYQKLFDQNPPVGPKYKSLLDKEVQSAGTPMQKVAVIHDYIRKNIRYIADEVSMNAIVPRAPDTVLQRQYGDCKDRAYLSASLARQYGLNVHMALISTRPQARFSGTHPTLYNHMIAVYEENGKKIFFDPTHKYCEFGNLPEGDIEGDALVLNPAKPERYRVPAPNTTPSLDISIDANLAAPKEGKALITLRNSYCFMARRAKLELQGNDLENYLSNLATSNFQKISLDYFKFQSETDTSMTFTADADLSQFIISSPTKKYMPQLPFSMVDSDILERENDSLDLYLGDRKGISMKISMDISGYKADSTGFSFGEAKSAFCSASLRPAENGRLTAQYTLGQHNKHLSGDEKKKYLEFCKSYLKSKKNMFVLTKRDQ